ncbi:MAG: DEAD/DEAH box helicase [Coleofasciculus sp. G3-WIS-01]|uniref:DEAD/DEAH box helicase n=1 Tax=Coleofasciculus sp. G3-WIS-01 TaxID=3069528 RepID=UPI0032F59FF8
MPGYEFGQSDFFHCEIFPILPGCEDANGIDFVAIPRESFILGKDKAEAVYFPKIQEIIWSKKQEEWEKNSIALDLESDGNRIWQFALLERGKPPVKLTGHELSDEEVRREFDELTAGKRVIGHNIKAWDLTILRQKGCDVDNVDIVDTLEEEMKLCPLRPCYALKTSHKATEDAEKVLELAINQYQRRDEAPETIREKAKQESDSFFLHSETPLWMQAINSLLKCKSKTLIIGPSDYAATLMQPPKAQVIQPTATPIFFEEGGEEFFQRYVEDVIKHGYRPIAELAPAILRQNWKLGEETSIPDIPADVNVVYCTFANYAQINIRKKIEAWGFNKSYLLFPELIPFDSRRLIRNLTSEEENERINAQGLWTRFGVGRSYVSLERLGLKKEALLKENDDCQGLTHFWLEKTIKGRIKLWGCLTEAYFEDHVPKRQYHSIIKANHSAEWFIPGEKSLDCRRIPETPSRADYWHNLLPFISHYCECEQPGCIILAVTESEEISPLHQLLEELSRTRKIKRDTILSYEKNQGDLRRTLRRLTKSENSLLLVPVRLLEKVVWEWQSVSEMSSAKLTILLESLPLPLIPILDLVKSDSAPLNSSLSEGELGENEQNPDGESNNREDADDESILAESENGIPSALSEIKVKCPNPTDTIKACIPVLIKTALGFANNSSVRLICLDPRLRSANVKEHNNFWQNDDLNLKEGRTFPDTLETVKSYFHQPEPFKLPDEKTWKPAIERVFIPADCQLSDEQMHHLRAILPRDDLDHRFISLPTGGGKSVLFQAPALYRGYHTNRLTVVISPLKALIKDQERSLQEKGFINTVDGLTGDLTREDIEECYQRIRTGECLLLYTAPERFRSQSFREALEERFSRDGEPEYWVFDEAHCLSLWGLDFRPDYFYAARFVTEQRKRGRNAPILILSATLTQQVRTDLETILKINRSASADQP